MSGILKGPGEFDKVENVRACVSCGETFAPWGMADSSRHGLGLLKPIPVPPVYRCISCRTPRRAAA